MADKKYKELSKRLVKKDKTSAAFTSRASKHISKTRLNKTQTNKAKQSSPSKSAKDSPPKIDDANKLKANKASARQAFRTGSRSSQKLATLNLPKMNTNILILIGCGLIIVFAVYMLAIRKNATEIVLNGDVFAHVKTVKLTEDVLLESVKARLEQEQGTKVQIEDTITLVLKHGKRSLLVDQSELINELVKTVSYKVSAAEIAVDGEVIGIVSSADEAEAIFRQVMQRFEPDTENEVTSTFVEDVSVNEKHVKQDYIAPSDEILTALLASNSVRDVYVVKDGDSLYAIAAAHSMTMDDISANNPGLDITKPIRVGDQINVVLTKPFVSVRTIETKREKKPIARPVDTEIDASLAPGNYRIKEPGKDGVKEVVTEITRLNGVVEKTEVVDEIEIEAPVTQIKIVAGS